MLKKFQQRLNLVLGSIPVLATLTVTSSPSIAATFASSSANAFLHSFSHAPLSIETLTDTETFTFASSGSVDANADSDAFFYNQIPLTFAVNSSLAKAEGYGQKYVGIAESEAAVIGRQFYIEAGSTFSFDFLSSLELETSIEKPPGEAAIAQGNISFFLFDDSTQKPIDFLTISGRLETAGNDDFFEVKASDGFNFLLDYSEQEFGGNQEFITAEYLGEFSRYFSEDTSLTLVEVKTNAVLVKAPEPSSFVAFFIFGVTGVALRKRKQF
ncbi:hypothetical protein VB834_17820 [Limnoraphis robusta Tam1]|uniref:PEP-CTERM sorting domain-containing protein n=1 Tax=Limnoraphis robusta CCNP1315 TaxID=3110306 RepID=A0ABU5U7M2_9CYAN|nr:hypothetical protein [Limnoraphis robusta]MEA5500953.1 hypothetical protein [Limnoraphis robusta BA-68 BA1]MEA5523205.1 hypothetical protein [Limnoraphis robusta CCNP1315]MEA5540881.1 hypothetical protein [Limnoraphis robusta Tam1]MEA5549197.1 hypothetical protein [Limnoraphis robusta CCNP1324]